MRDFSKIVILFILRKTLVKQDKQYVVERIAMA